MIRARSGGWGGLSDEIPARQKTWRIGFVKEVVPAGDLMRAAVEILNRIAGNALAVRFALEAGTREFVSSQESAGPMNRNSPKESCDVRIRLAEKPKSEDVTGVPHWTFASTTLSGAFHLPG